LDGQVGLVTAGGGIVAGVARELATAGMRIAVTGRTEAQVRAVASSPLWPGESCDVISDVKLAERIVAAP